VCASNDADAHIYVFPYLEIYACWFCPCGCTEEEKEEE
jgi:hypothetical protein